MNSGFYLGQRVRFTQDYGPGLNKLGTVVCVRSFDNIGVQFDNPHGGHTCDGFSQEERGWWCGSHNIETAESNVYKVGDKLVPNQSLKNDCGCEWHDAAYIQITTVGGNDDYYYYDVYEANGDYIEACSGHEGAFKEGMEYYQEAKQVVDVPLAPINSFVGSGTTTMHPGMTVQSIAPTARIGWMDEPVFIPKEEPKEEPVGTINIVPVTNAKHSANLRKLIGHRNFKSRVNA